MSYVNFLTVGEDLVAVYMDSLTDVVAVHIVYM